LALDEILEKEKEDEESKRPGAAYYKSISSVRKDSKKE